MAGNSFKARFFTYNMPNFCIGSSKSGLIFSFTQQLQTVLSVTYFSTSLFSNEKICGNPIGYAALFGIYERIYTCFYLLTPEYIKRCVEAPIFPVLICIVSIVSGFLTPLCNCRIRALTVFWAKRKKKMGFDWGLLYLTHLG